MTKEELKNWVLYKYNNCYKAKNHTQSTFYFYDEQFIRQKKLSRIVGKEIVYPSEVKGICLFEYDPNYETLYCNKKEIWNFLEKYIQSRYVYNSTPDFVRYEYENIQSFIRDSITHISTGKKKLINIESLTFDDSYNYNNFRVL